MSRIDDMRELGQTIIEAYSARVEDLNKLREDTLAMLAKFEATRNQIAAELKEKLTQIRAGREAEVAQMLEDFRTLRKEMSGELRQIMAMDREELSLQVKEVLEELRAIRAEVGRLWQEMEENLRLKRMK